MRDSAKMVTKLLLMSWRLHLMVNVNFSNNSISPVRTFEQALNFCSFFTKISSQP